MTLCIDVKVEAQDKSSYFLQAGLSLEMKDLKAIYSDARKGTMM